MEPFLKISIIYLSDVIFFHWYKCHLMFPAMNLLFTFSSFGSCNCSLYSCPFSHEQNSSWRLASFLILWYSYFWFCSCCGMNDFASGGCWWCICCWKCSFLFVCCCFFLGGGVVELSWLLIFDCPALNVLSKKEHRIWWNIFCQSPEMNWQFMIH